jgi:hypothetical protein
MYKEANSNQVAFLQQQKKVWIGCTHVKIVESVTKSVRPFLIGLPQSTMLLSRLTLSEEDRKERVNGY